MKKVSIRFLRSADHKLCFYLFFKSILIVLISPTKLFGLTRRRYWGRFLASSPMSVEKDKIDQWLNFSAISVNYGTDIAENTRGAHGGTRTHDILIAGQILPLSYMHPLLLYVKRLIYTGQGLEPAVYWVVGANYSSSRQSRADRTQKVSRICYSLCFRVRCCCFAVSATELLLFCGWPISRWNTFVFISRGLHTPNFQWLFHESAIFGYILHENDTKRPKIN